MHLSFSLLKYYVKFSQQMIVNVYDSNFWVLIQEQ
jgi:hypothetical protein